MDWYDRYKNSLELVFHKALEKIAEFPSPLNAIGLHYAEAFNPVNNENGTDFICTLLPYWMQEEIDLSDQQREQFVLVNIYGMLYFFIQDDVMDDKDYSSLKQRLALGNLFYLHMLNLLRELFPSNSAFWTYYDRYLTTWADCVVNEDDSNYFMNNPILTAGKASPIKLSSTGALLLARQTERVEAAEAAVDLALMTLQMLDDWADWQKDLEEGSYNGLIAMIASEQGEGTMSSQLTTNKVETHIYVLGCMNRYAEIAVRNHAQLLSLHPPITSLIAYHSYMVDSLQQIAQQIEENKRRQLAGGLNRYFA